jgi:hypothetical protein
MALLHWHISFDLVTFYEKLLLWLQFGKLTTKYGMSTATKTRRLHGEKPQAITGEKCTFKGVN